MEDNQNTQLAMTQGNSSSLRLASSLKLGESHQKLLSRSCFSAGPAAVPRSSAIAREATQQAAEGPQRVAVGLVGLWLNLSALPGTAAGPTLSTANPAVAGRKSGTPILKESHPWSLQ